MVVRVNHMELERPVFSLQPKPAGSTQSWSKELCTSPWQFLEKNLAPREPKRCLVLIVLTSVNRSTGVSRMVQIPDWLMIGGGRRRGDGAGRQAGSRRELMLSRELEKEGVLGWWRSR